MCAENVMKKNRKLSFIAIPAILLTAAVAVSAMVALKNEYWKQ
jgi:hypothetical protein